MIDVCNCVEFCAKKAPEREWKEREGEGTEIQRDRQTERLRESWR